TPTNPHTQLTQNAPEDLQERVFALARSLPRVVVGPSAVSVPGARAVHAPESTEAPSEAFMVGREFAHLHPSGDGSLHMALPPDIVDRVIENGWAERHPLAGRYGLPGNIVRCAGRAMRTSSQSSRTSCEPRTRSRPADPRGPRRAPSVPDRDPRVVDELGWIRKRARRAGRDPLGAPGGRCYVENVVGGAKADAPSCSSSRSPNRSSTLPAEEPGAQERRRDGA
ncbi:MAG: luciferase family protein, partial [Gaiellaceae bacterium]